MTDYLQTKTLLGPYVCVPGGRRKKRALVSDTKSAPSDLIEATPKYNDEDIMEDNDSEPELDGTERDAKIFNYFMTATKTTTFTSYTATSTLASILCTPEGWTMPACAGSAGKKKKK